eukprot:365810-Chlamydomonas_euryale.AAC.22
MGRRRSVLGSRPHTPFIAAAQNFESLTVAHTVPRRRACGRTTVAARRLPVTQSSAAVSRCEPRVGGAGCALDVTNQQAVAATLHPIFSFPQKI